MGEDELAGAVPIAAGILGLAYGGFSWKMKNRWPPASADATRPVTSSR